MTLELLPDGSGIHLKLSRLNDEDLFALNNAAHSYPGFETLSHVISDFSAVPDCNLTIAAVRRIAEIDAAAVRRNPGMLLAIVANKQVIRGMSNVYRVYFEQAALTTPSWQSKYFESLEAAREWVTEECDTPLSLVR